MKHRYHHADAADTALQRPSPGMRGCDWVALGVCLWILASVACAGQADDRGWSAEKQNQSTNTSVTTQTSRHSR
jgi:hypothetical protein